MSQLKKAMIGVDESIEELKKAVYSKETLSLSKDEVTVYNALSHKFNDIIGLINYIGENQNELCNTTRKDSLKD